MSIMTHDCHKNYATHHAFFRRKAFASAVRQLPWFPTGWHYCTSGHRRSAQPHNGFHLSGRLCAYRICLIWYFVFATTGDVFSNLQKCADARRYCFDDSTFSILLVGHGLKGFQAKLFSYLMAVFSSHYFHWWALLAGIIAIEEAIFPRATNTLPSCYIRRAIWQIWRLLLKGQKELISISITLNGISTRGD